MSRALLRDTILCATVFVLALAAPDRFTFGFWVEGVALLAIAVKQERIDRSAA